MAQPIIFPISLCLPDLVNGTPSDFERCLLALDIPNALFQEKENPMENADIGDIKYGLNDVCIIVKVNKLGSF